MIDDDLGEYATVRRQLADAEDYIATLEKAIEERDRLLVILQRELKKAGVDVITVNDVQ